MNRLDEFFRDIDASWPQPPGASKLPLFVLGSGALMLQTSYQRDTRDGDVLETIDLSADARSALRKIAGPRTELAERQGMYVELVRDRLPFLPRPPRWNRLGALSDALVHFEIHALDVVDVVVSKLARFSEPDQNDITAMIRSGFVTHAQVLARLACASYEFERDPRIAEIPSYFENFNRVERDLFLVPPTKF